MPITFFKKLRDVLPHKDLKFLLHEHLHVRDPHRGVKTVHASELTHDEREFCPRFYALADVTKAKLPDRWLSTSESVTFAMGKWLQDQVVHWFAEMGRAVGHWVCVSCNQLHEFQLRPVKCKSCGSRVFKPEEVRFVSAKSGASCGVDMLINTGKPLLVPVEIKTMDKDVFKALVAPLAEHRLRTTLYLRIIAESGHHWANRVDTSMAHVLYVSKGGFGCADPQLKTWDIYEHFSPFKSYEVPRNDKLAEPQSRLARVVKQFREGKVGMPAGVCPTAMTKRAKICPLCKACFAGDYPPVHHWQGGLG